MYIMVSTYLFAQSSTDDGSPKATRQCHGYTCSLWKWLNYLKSMGKPTFYDWVKSLVLVNLATQFSWLSIRLSDYSTVMGWSPCCEGHVLSGKLPSTSDSSVDRAVKLLARNGLVLFTTIWVHSLDNSPLLQNWKIVLKTAKSLVYQPHPVLQHL